MMKMIACWMDGWMDRHASEGERKGESRRKTYLLFRVY